MTKSTIKHRSTAFFFLVIFSMQTFYPTVSYALTSGPTTPEMASFEPASTANMVDMFSGDFSYNIPLLDVGGYPLNLSYHSGAGPEEEASWVGFGWTLNPGAINRQLRGLPDDFSGETITQIDNKKPTITVSANVTGSTKFWAIRIPKLKKLSAKGKAKVKLGISHNNYTGFGGVIGLGTAFSASKQSADGFTKGLGLNGSAGINVSSQSGINPYAEFDLNYKITSKKEKQAQKDLRAAQGEHLGNMWINDCWGAEVIDENASAAKVTDMAALLNKETSSSKDFGSSSINFNGFQPPAAVQTPMESFNFSASLEFGPHVFGGSLTPGIEGSYSKQNLKNNTNEAPGYGFMNSHLASTNDDAVLDYNMSKEAPYIKRLPNLGVTVFTPDLFSVTSNAGSMQFRPYLKGTGVFFQPHKYERDISPTIGLQTAAGSVFHFSLPLQINKTNSISGKWNSNNKYVDYGNFKQTDKNNPENQAFYFKRVGEKSKQDSRYFSALGNTAAVAVRIDKTPGAWLIGKGNAKNTLRVDGGADIDISNAYLTPQRTIRDKANNAITYLNATEASRYALDKQIPNYKPGVLPTTAGANDPIPRVDGVRRATHISQYSITQDDGQRMIYGTPVYNVDQSDVTFAISENANVNNGIVTYNSTDNSIGNKNGKDNFYHKSKMPSYTTGHLLTGILSPDYVDQKGDGITDDDLGTAVKFNYSQITSASNLYNWRTPYTNVAGNMNTATYARGYNSVKYDDKANYSWGKKEIWNLHSIESKTMVAQFYVERRNDGIGVKDENGGKGSDDILKRVKEIKLFSKADLYANGSNAVPIKVVHFEYYEDYPLLSGLPNNNTGGKLTLKRIWFSYGKNEKGRYNSYNFKYKIPANNVYLDGQSDRWGTYKPSSLNPPGLDNTDFPYATQDKTKADANVSNWQMNEIELPSGGVINVDYESDDYSYVQNRRAAQMCPLTGIGTPGLTTGFGKADKFYIELPQPCASNSELKQRYFENMESLSYKSYVDLDGQGHWEWISGYAKINSYSLINSNLVEITVEKIDKFNPLAKAAWQKLKLELPLYAYPEYDNIDSENLGFVSAIRALGSTFSRFSELVESFDKRAYRKGLGDKIDPTKSWVRLCTPIGINANLKGKLGGGHRVKEIRINDKWAAMSEVANAETGTYGQTYEYTTDYVGPTGLREKISSGVASYEPIVGGEENPFHEPVNYSDRHFFTKPKYYFLEKPMGEAFFPGASVGYSKITVRNIGADGSVGATGTSVSEYYTAKDFPTKASELSMERTSPKLNFLPKLFGAKITSAVTASQGYVIENNDMHGKQKAETVFARNEENIPISSAKYYYKVKNEAAETMDLDNVVKVIDKNRQIEDATVGMDIDMFTEMNESTMENIGVAIDPAIQINNFFPPLIKVKLPFPKPNYERRMYRGSTTTKLVNRYAILQKVVKTVNGSTNVSENMLWDAETGEVLLSKTNNEFKESTYSFSYPAHWAYDGMGSAFKNEGVYLDGLSIDATGQITNYNSLLVPGDEIIMTNGGKKLYWVSKPGNNGSNALYLINKDGVPPGGALTFNAKILRSGRRNLAAASVGTIISMVNPIESGALNFDVAKRILQSKAISYDEYWPMPVAFNAGAPVAYTPTDCQTIGNRIAAEGDTIYRMQKNAKGNMEIVKTVAPINSSSSLVPLPSSCNCKCLKKLFDYLMATNQLFTTQAQNLTVGTLVNMANTAGYNVGSCSVLDNNLNKPFYALTTATVGTVYMAQVGDCKISIRSNSTNPVTFGSLVSQPCGINPIVNYSNGGIQSFSLSLPIDCSIIYNGGFQSGLPSSVNSTKIVAASSNNGPVSTYYYNSTNFRIFGLSQIPSNATINSANLFLYAHPEGYITSLYPNAHTTITETSNNPFILSSNAATANSSCTNTFYNGWETPSNYLNITSNFQDFNLDVKNIVMSMLVNNYRWMGILPGQVTFGTYNYATFCSQTYPVINKRPKLEVTYSLSAPIAITATLQIDECIGAGSCQPPIVNPYFTGILGNWRAKTEYLYDTKRVNNVLNSDPNLESGTNLRNSGYFAAFNSFWVNNGASIFPAGANDANWRWTSQTTKYNRKGQEIENRDALDRYSSSQYGYLESVPVAVASNARYREIGYDGFEDYNFNLGNALAPWDSCAIQDHFSFRNFMGTAAQPDATTSHTGKYSMKLNGTVVINKPIMQTEPYLIYTTAANNYKITDGYLRWGFLPMPSKKYILSGWVKDAQPRSSSINGLTVKVSGTPYDVNLNNAVASKVHVVEGWKRFEVVVDMPAFGKFNLELTGANVNVDDIRIHPYDAQLKSYAYDASSMRLMADLDENNFATFYEYDDEGTLVRVKKETEKGISTIKETRSSIRKRVP
jgi:hypothetical protein